MRSGPTPRSLLLGMTLFCGFAALSAAKTMAATPPQPPGSTLTVKLAGTGHGTVASSDGYISCGNACVHIYPHSSTVTLTATPASGSSFDGWTGPCASTTPTTCTLTPTGDETVTATFTQGSSGPGGTPPPSPPAPRCTAHLASRTILLKVHKHHAAGAKTTVGTVTIKLGCDQAGSGKLVLKLRGHVPTRAHHAKKRSFTLSRTVTVSAHHTERITIKLPAGVLAGLKKKLGEALSGTLSVKNANGTATVTLKGGKLAGKG
jgi:uncharacterized repeat protein (TIGR02543 family)